MTLLTEMSHRDNNYKVINKKITKINLNTTVKTWIWRERVQSMVVGGYRLICENVIVVWLVLTREKGNIFMYKTKYKKWYENVTMTSTVRDNIRVKIYSTYDSTEVGGGKNCLTCNYQSPT